MPNAEMKDKIPKRFLVELLLRYPFAARLGQGVIDFEPKVYPDGARDGAYRSPNPEAIATSRNWNSRDRGPHISEIIEEHKRKLVELDESQAGQRLRKRSQRFSTLPSNTASPPSSGSGDAASSLAGQPRTLPLPPPKNRLVIGTGAGELP